MKEKWLSVQKDCKFKYFPCSSKSYCHLHEGVVPCIIKNCQIFKFAEALLQPEPELIKLPTLYDLWLKGDAAVKEVKGDYPHPIAEKKVAFQYNGRCMLKIKECEYVKDTLVYHLEDY